MLVRKLQHQATSGAASDVSVSVRSQSFGLEDLAVSTSSAPAQRTWYEKWLGCDALLRLANTYYASRMAIVTLTSCFLMLLLCIFSIDSTGFWLWMAFQVTNTILGISALPSVCLYSIVAMQESDHVDDAAARASIDSMAASPERGKRSRVTSFSFLRSSFHDIETKLEPFLLKRSSMLRFCETIVVLQTVLLFIVVLLSILLVWVHHEAFWNSSMFSTASGLGFLAVVCVYLQTKEFDRLRAHEQLQLGAGLDQDLLDIAQTHRKRPNSSSRISALFTPDPTPDAQLHLPQQATSPDHRITLDLGNSAEAVEKELRRGLYEATVNRDHDKARALLEVMERALESKMKVQLLLLKMYATPTLWFWSFAFTTHNPLHVACRLGDERMVEILLQGGMNPNLLDKTQGEPFSLRLLYEICQGRPQNVTNVLGAPLHVAVAHGHTHVVDVLVLHNTNLDGAAQTTANIDVVAQTSFYSQSMRVPPIFLADSADVIESLIRHRANFLMVPGKGNTMSVTVLQRAMLHDRSELENVLKEWGADVALTPLHEAAAAGDTPTVQHYLSLGIPPDQLGEFHDGVNRRTPLHWASVMGRSAVVAELVKRNANVNALDARLRTPLHWAARHCHVTAIDALLKAGADPLLCDDEGLTPLAFSAAGGMLNGECVALFLAAGVEINQRLPNQYGDTCLHLALREGHQDAALALIQSGNADLASYNTLGEPAIKCCASAEQLYAIKVISKWVDIVISYDAAYRQLAEHLKHGIEESYLTVFMRHVDDDALASMNVMKEASAVVCVLTPDFERNIIGMEELAHAKEIRVPVMAITIESVTLPEVLQVYLYTRQLVPFRDAILTTRRRSSAAPPRAGTPTSEDTREFTFKLDPIKFKRSLQNLIDGLRDEVELHDLGLARNGNEAEDQDTTSRLSEVGRSSSATAVVRATSPNFRPNLARASTTRRRTINEVVKDVLSRRRRSAAFQFQGLSAQALPRTSVFLSHGDCHTDFVTMLHKELTRQEIHVTLDSISQVASMKDRILAAKNAILESDIFLVVLSEKSVKTELVSDQLAFAEDKGKAIVPIYYTRRPGLMDTTVRQLLEDATERPIQIFGNGISYGRGVDELLAELKLEQQRMQREAEARETDTWIPVSPAARHAAERLLERSHIKSYSPSTTILV